MSEASEVMVFVEILGGSRNKYELDRETGTIVLESGKSTRTEGFTSRAETLALIEEARRRAAGP